MALSKIESASIESGQTLTSPTISGTLTITDVNAASTLSLKTGGTTAVTIDSSQRVGVGTSSPSGMLDVGAGSTSAPTYTGYIRIGGHTAQSLSTNGGLEFFATPYGSGYGWRICGIDLGSGSVPLVFQTRQNSTSWTERMRLDENGTLGIGTTNIPTTNALLVKSNYGSATMRVYNTSGTNVYLVSWHNSTQECGTITTGNNTVGYNSNSDYRLKENIAPMTGALDKVELLKPVTYTWKQDGTAGQGFIAHELQEVVPDCVTGEKDAVDEEGNPVYQGVDTSFLVATLTAAIQELTARVKELEAKVK